MVGVALAVVGSTRLFNRYAGSLTFPGQWQEASHPGIERTFQKHDVDCPQAYWMRSTANRREFLVYCAAPDSDWSAYLVRPKSEKVTPLSALPSGIPTPGA